MVVVWSTVVNCTSQVRYGKHPKILNNTVSSKVVYFNESNPLGRHYLYRAELNVSNFLLYLSLFTLIYFRTYSILSNNLYHLSFSLLAYLLFTSLLFSKLWVWTLILMFHCFVAKSLASLGKVCESVVNFIYSWEFFLSPGWG